MLAEGIPLGPFLVDENGRLSLRSPDAAPGFSFAWRGRRFSAVLGDGHMAFTGTIGQVPSSSAGAAQREAALALVRALPGCVPPGTTVSLLPDHRIQIQVTEPMAWPATAALVIQPVLRFLLALAPTLDLMEENGFAPACPA